MLSQRATRCTSVPSPLSPCISATEMLFTFLQVTCSVCGRRRPRVSPLPYTIPAHFLFYFRAFFLLPFYSAFRYLQRNPCSPNAISWKLLQRVIMFHHLGAHPLIIHILMTSKHQFAHHHHFTYCFKVVVQLQLRMAVPLSSPRSQLLRCWCCFNPSTPHVISFARA